MLLSQNAIEGLYSRLTDRTTIDTYKAIMHRLKSDGDWHVVVGGVSRSIQAILNFAGHDKARLDRVVDLILEQWYGEKGVPWNDREYNMGVLQEAVARLIGYETFSSLADAQAEYAERIARVLRKADYNGEYLWRQHLDADEIPQVAELFVRRLAQRDAHQSQVVETNEPPSVPAVPAFPIEAATTIGMPKTPAETYQAALKFLQGERDKNGFTYNQVKEAIGSQDFRLVSRVLRGMTNDDSGVILHTVKKNGKAVPLYKFAPERKAIDQDWKQTDRIVRGMLVEIVGRRPGATVRQILQTARAWLVTADDHLIQRLVKELVTESVLQMEPGRRGAKCHYVSNRGGSVVGV